MLIGLSAVMVLLGPGAPVARAHPLLFAGYWLVFSLFLVGALYCVLLDIRYIRLEYRLARRRLFHETLGSEDLRRAPKEPTDRDRTSAGPAGSSDPGDPQ